MTAVPLGVACVQTPDALNGSFRTCPSTSSSGVPVHVFLRFPPHPQSKHVHLPSVPPPGTVMRDLGVQAYGQQNAW